MNVYKLGFVFSFFTGMTLFVFKSDLASYFSLSLSNLSGIGAFLVLLALGIVLFRYLTEGYVVSLPAFARKQSDPLAGHYSPETQQLGFQEHKEQEVSASSELQQTQKPDVLFIEPGLNKKYVLSNMNILKVRIQNRLNKSYDLLARSKKLLFVLGFYLAGISAAVVFQAFTTVHIAPLILFVLALAVTLLAIGIKKRLKAKYQAQKDNLLQIEMKIKRFTTVAKSYEDKVFLEKIQESFSEEERHLLLQQALSA